MVRKVKQYGTTAAGRGRGGKGTTQARRRTAQRFTSSGAIATQAPVEQRPRMGSPVLGKRCRERATTIGREEDLHDAVDDGHQWRPVSPPRVPPVTATAPTGPHESNCTRLPSKSTPFSSSTAHTRQAGGLRGTSGGGENRPRKAEATNAIWAIQSLAVRRSSSWRTTVRNGARRAQHAPSASPEEDGAAWGRSGCRRCRRA